ncbi:MAG: hypothetical protein AUJ34_03225 [Parcubacteria group bacterium CG1_02_41_12]|nr:MAG: hypothetical protein AUJ34_03225 [Parcubacteria group bacterium CG1_02_41_12]
MKYKWNRRARGVAGAEEYDPKAAHAKYQDRRKRSKYSGMLLNRNNDLLKYVVAKLKIGWSPDSIAGRMKQEKFPFYASGRSIYAYLYSPYGQRHCKYLRSHRYTKRKQKGKKQKRTLIPNKTSIHDRPEEIDCKSEYGHYEGDTIVSGKKTGSKTAIVTIYERKAMYIDARKISSLSPKQYNPAVAGIFGKLTESKTWTLDNGIENVDYESLEKQLNIKTYFCDPYSSWQKPGVENANKLIRRFIPKGSDISNYSYQFIGKNIRQLNNTPRKALEWKTPNEVMSEQNLFKKKSK